ncbi:WH2 domain-containing protein [Entamoeba marina]
MATTDTFSVKTKDEMKEIEELTSFMLNHVSSIQPCYKRLVEDCESYSKAKNALANCSSNLASTLKGMLVNQTGADDINTALQCVSGMLEAEANGHNETNKILQEKTITVFKGETNDVSKKVKDLEKNIKAERKKLEEAKEKATKRAKNLKKDDNLKELMENISTAEKNIQMGMINGLKDSTNLMCQMYCKIVTEMFKFLEYQQNNSSLNVMFLEKNTPRIKKMSKTLNVWPRKVKDLITNKKQILIDTTWLSDDLKQILRDAGVKRKDLANPDTVQMLINIITEQVSSGNLPSDILDQLQTKDKSPELHQICISPRSMTTSISTKKPSSPRKSNNEKTPKSPRSHSNISKAKINDSNVIQVHSNPTSNPPTNPSIPPPPLDPSAPPPPPPPMAKNTEKSLKPVNVTSAPSLLDQIQKNKQLAPSRHKPSPSSLNKSQKVDLTSLLASAMQKRREDIADDVEEEEEDMDDSGDWDD